MPNNNDFLDRVFSFFLRSNDFNGIPLRTLAENLDIPYTIAIEITKTLILEDKVSIQSSTNPHIIGLGHGLSEQQIQILEEAKNSQVKIVDNFANFQLYTEPISICVYPSQSYLRDNRLLDEYKRKPYSKQLAIGEPQLSFAFFDIDVLERYSKDPRFDFQFRDFSGQISYKVDKEHKPLVKSRDEIFLKTFGLGRDKDNERVAVVFLRYLSNMNEEHQLYWQSFENHNESKVYEEYYYTSIEGQFTRSISVFTAFLHELDVLNKISRAIFNEPLFLKSYIDKNRPENFDLLFISTLHNYHNFIMTLDKIISDNLNKKFFEIVGVIDHDMHVLNDGTKERKLKGTLSMLQEWLEQQITVTTGSIKELVKPFKNIRLERQKPAHAIKANTFDKSLILKKENHMWAVYYSMKSLRMIFEQHPDATEIATPSWLNESSVKCF